MSVFLAAECRGQDFVLEGYRDGGFGLAELATGSARACGQGVVRFHVDGQPGHAHVVGRKTDATQKCLRDAASILVESVKDQYETPP